MTEANEFTATPSDRRAAISRIAATALVTLPFWASAARAHGDKPHASKTGPVIKEQKDWPPSTSFLPTATIETGLDLITDLLSALLMESRGSQSETKDELRRHLINSSLLLTPILVTSI